MLQRFHAHQFHIRRFVIHHTLFHHQMRWQCARTFFPTAVVCENKGESSSLFYFRHSSLFTARQRRQRWVIVFVLFQARLFVRRTATAVRSLSNANTYVCVWDAHCEKIIKRLSITTRMSLYATRSCDNNELSSDRQRSYMHVQTSITNRLSLCAKHSWRQ